eukprot:7949339-Lingulodinium_polyedra.AAC.1
MPSSSPRSGAYCLRRLWRALCLGLLAFTATCGIMATQDEKADDISKNADSELAFVFAESDLGIDA